MSQRKGPKRWTGVLWGAINSSDRSFVNAPRNSLWCSLTRKYPLLSSVRTTFDLSAADCTPVRVRVTITPLPGGRRAGRKG